MKSLVKTVLYTALLMLVASLFGYHITRGNYVSSKQYMQDVLSKGGAEAVSKELTVQYAKDFGPGFDSIRFQSEMGACLHTRIDAWLNGNDPRLTQTITKDTAKEFGGEFVSACLNDLSNGVR